MEIWITAIAVLLLICMSGFFSGSETALTAVSRGRMKQLANQGNERADAVSRITENKERLIGALLIGNNLVNVLSSALATSLFLSLFGETGVVYATLVMTVMLVVFAEVLPKYLGISKTDRFAMTVVPLIKRFVAIVAPLAHAVDVIVRRILGLVGIRIGAGQSLLSAHEELRGAVEVLHEEGSFVKEERDRLAGALDLSELDVGDIMVHRTAMRMVNADDPPETVVREILESPYTRMPVWRGENDNIVGIVHAKDMLRALHAVDNDPTQIDIMKVANKPWFVPDTTMLQDQLNAFLRRKAHVALVVDEYGELEGLVTLEDIIEEIIGDISDEHDVEVAGVTTEADGSVVVDGSVPIRDLNRALDWDLPDDDANTIAGLVIHEAKTIPLEKQTFTFYDKRFVVLKRERNRIRKLRIRPC
ncbi:MULTISPECIES: HlyC/CorC family transporter [unclassified Roseitalea]|uniref:HlyC/CorC family transporter n=1 Tax=unclassified Roseitalea TaxID=2639107 RepID=UPI00273E532A|nr:MULTISPECIES: HlyC/CorC family transporter [unclassified Roseitalea]